ncbi:DUF3579 domain-containing protein [soil metagenome]
MAVEQGAAEWVIEGVTADGRQFRPSDWSERLCGVLSSFRPTAGRGAYAHLGYSPYARPASIGAVKCVIVDERLREIEAMAWDFVQSFARENGLPFRKLEKAG